MKLPRLYPGMTKLFTPEAMGLGPMSPRGVTIHYTAGLGLDGIRGTLLQRGYGYHLVILKDGEVVQLTYFDLRVNHAGKAKWAGISPNHEHIAIALESWGQLIPVMNTFLTWTSKEVDAKDIAIRGGNVNSVEAAWDKATDDQERALLQVLHWLIGEGIGVGDICGHDECAIPLGRKDDPGGVLSMKMPALRRLLGGPK